MSVEEIPEEEKEFFVSLQGENKDPETETWRYRYT